MPYFEQIKKDNDPAASQKIIDYLKTKQPETKPETIEIIEPVHEPKEIELSESELLKQTENDKI